MSTFVRPKWARFGRAALVGALVALFGAPAVASGQSLADKYQQARERHENMPRARFSLRAEPSVVLQANQFQCGLLNSGETCTDIFDSPTGGGGFWPTGSPNQYMFNSGIMIAGIIPADAGFEWAGDTTGAYFFDARGTQQHGTPITNIYNSLNPDDLANWPDLGDVPGFPEATAYIVDEDIFSDVLIGRQFGSQQDTWVMYWDGDPALSANRDHPMGVAVEQRTMAWNFPAGNEATIYIFYKLTNVTDNPTFQALNEGKFGIELPDEGYRIDSIYMSYAADPDVTTDATENFASVILPFNMGITYHAQFVANEFSYPPSLFYPPFFTNAPGIIGVQYLKSPEDPDTGEEVGLTMFSVHENPGSCTGLCDPLGDKQLWRYISGNVSVGQGDPPCSFSDPQTSRICYLPQVPADARFFQASGPFSLDPGQSATIVVAMMAAATVNTPEIVIGSDNPPGIPSLQPGCGGEEILPIEVGAGWVSTPTEACVEAGDIDEGNPVDLRDVNVVPNSLLGRAQVAQAVFDGKFLLPFAPEPPPFVLVPGDEQIAIIWGPSPTETEGDPFFAAAQDSTSPLFNPNFREFDVEGYRIYRSTDNANFELIAQFDYEGTEFIDVRCESDRSFVPGVDTCDTSDTVVVPINDVTDLNGDFIIDPFVLFGGADAQRLRLEDGRTLAIRGDSATPGTTPDLTDTGMPFAFIDTDVVNNFQYYYQVRAFDINSTFSGPISLESSSSPTNPCSPNSASACAIPQEPAPNQVLASFSQTILGDDETPLDPTADLPALHPEDGTWSGPMPPTNGIEAAFVPLVPRLLGAFSVEATIDSVVGRNSDDPGGCPAGENIQGSCWRMFLTYDVSGTVTQSVADGWTPFYTAFGEPLTTSFSLGGAVVEEDPTWSEEFDIPENFPGFTASLTGTWQQGVDQGAFMEGQSNRRRGGCPSGTSTATGGCPRFMHGGARWFDGTVETNPDPTMYTAVGELAGIDTVIGGINHTPRAPGDLATASYSTAMQCFDFTGMHYGRAADVRFTWGATGFDEVRDITHNVDIRFQDAPRAGTYGFMTVPENDANGNGFIDWEDFNHLQSILGEAKHVGFCGAAGGSVDPADPDRFLSATPELTGVSTQYGAVATLTQTGTGFGLYVNGDWYIFQAAALPAAGTVWTLRTYSGRVRTAGEFADLDATGYEFFPAIRPANIPGLRVRFESEAATQLVGNPDLRLVHTVPDPYYAQSNYDLSPVEKAIRFVNLPAQATIRIYTVSGLLVDVINHNDPALGGLATWDLKNRSGQFVASGVYFFHVATPDGQEHIGRFTVINSGIGQ